MGRAAEQLKQEQPFKPASGLSPLASMLRYRPMLSKASMHSTPATAAEATGAPHPPAHPGTTATQGARRTFTSLARVPAGTATHTLTSVEVWSQRSMLPSGTAIHACVVAGARRADKALTTACGLGRQADWQVGMPMFASRVHEGARLPCAMRLALKFTPVTHVPGLAHCQRGCGVVDLS